MPKKLAVITDDELIPFWRNVEATLKARGMTMSEMVKKAGLNTTIYYKKRNNKLPDDDQQHKIALALRVCVGELRTGKSSGEPGAIEAYEDSEEKTCMNCGKAPLHDDCAHCKVGTREMWVPEDVEKVIKKPENVAKTVENVAKTVENVAEDDENYKIETVEPETIYAEQVKAELEEPKVNLTEAHAVLEKADTPHEIPIVAWNDPLDNNSKQEQRLWAMNEINSLLNGKSALDAIEKIKALKRASEFYLDYLEGK